MNKWEIFKSAVNVSIDIIKIKDLYTLAETISVLDITDVICIEAVALHLNGKSVKCDEQLDVGKTSYKVNVSTMETVLVYVPDNGLIYCEF